MNKMTLDFHGTARDRQSDLQVAAEAFSELIEDGWVLTTEPESILEELEPDQTRRTIRITVEVLP